MMMSALPPSESRSMRAGEPPAAIVRKWDALHDDAAQLASIADLAPEQGEAGSDSFSEHLKHASGWQCRLALQHIEDIDAMMQPGLAALKTITSRGQDPVAPALALWREFYAAREAVLRLIDPAPGVGAQNAA